ncbi:MAG: alpha/beta hydrolase [Rhodobacteraceae bacterium]|nr:alpha/beta hydrolase [Paracoccaceae bacterium]
MEAAPFFAEVAEGPEGGAAWWLRTDDGVRIRMGYWPCKDARGTVLLFPGRTECVEKYGRTAADFARRGYAMLAVDWRGQGLADRFLADRDTGHVGRFADYQRDVRAVMAAAATLDVPRPWHILGHSMGGLIGLRAAAEGADVASAAFSAPMWGVVMKAWMRPFARIVTAASGPAGFGHLYAPGASVRNYVTTAPFEGNQLTRDADMFAYMRGQLLAYPELMLGGPSFHWVHEGLAEIRRFRTGPLPDLPVYIGIGGGERIVDIPAVRAMAARWPGAEFDEFPGAEHELLMELPEVRDRFLDRAVALFDRAAGGKAAAPRSGASSAAGRPEVPAATGLSARAAAC